MARAARLVTLLILALVLAPAAASAAPRMWVGFEDGPGFRWSPDRQANLNSAEQANATIVRETVYWYRVAPTRPASPSNPFDNAYRFDDLDELVRNAQTRGLEVMLTIWGTPSWANGGQSQNRAPTSVSDLTAFAHALAARYSGRYPGYPFVRYFSVWNEPNLGLFLSPQFGASGAPVAPALYAQLYRAGYAGIKSGNPQALVALGETSNQGRDRPLHSSTQQDSESPGSFARLLSEVRPRLQFDAWAEHPYAVRPNLPPLAPVRWPNVTLSQLKRFETALDSWFGRRDIPIWITEYGYQTKPQNPLGVFSVAQAAYAKQALAIARDDPRVQMFIWFTLRDDPSNLWKSGLLAQSGARKPSFAAFAAAARPLDARNAIVPVKAGVLNPVVRVSALELAAHSSPGTPVSVSYVVSFDRLTPIQNRTIPVPLGRDGWLTVPLLGVRPAAGHSYSVSLWALDPHGVRAARTFDLDVVLSTSPSLARKAHARGRSGRPRRASA